VEVVLDKLLIVFALKHNPVKLPLAKGPSGIGSDCLINSRIFTVSSRHKIKIMYSASYTKQDGISSIYIKIIYKKNALSCWNVGGKTRTVLHVLSANKLE
jgi:hypothetical protein